MTATALPPLQSSPPDPTPPAAPEALQVEPPATRHVTADAAPPQGENMSPGIISTRAIGDGTRTNLVPPQASVSTSLSATAPSASSPAPPQRISPPGSPPPPHHSAEASTGDGEADADEKNIGVAGSATSRQHSRPPQGAAKRRHISQASALEHETKSILGRISERDTSMVSRRAFSYEPSLEVFRDTSFTDYVRGALLGIPGIIEESDDEEEEEESDDEEENEEKKGERKNDGKGGEGIEEDGEKEESVAGQVKKAESTAAAAPATEENKKSTKEPPRRPATRGATKKAELEAKAQNEAEQQQQQPPAPTRASARIRARIIGSRCSHISKPGSSPSQRAARPIVASTNAPRAEPNEMLLADGIAKITPPAGWWDHAGIGNDLTGRGKIWSGGRLGNMLVTTPIKQCASGIGGVYDYTMLELPPMTVHEFREQADAYRKRQIGRELDEDTSDEFMDGLARKFWKRLGPTMEPSIYGADMEGTLFDGDDACGWNVDRLESSLALLGADMDPNEEEDEDADHNSMPAGRLPGVTTAYLYFGMWGATFAAHTEDMNLFSINYLHAGAPKYWYAIDPRDASRFESLATSHFPAAASQCPDFLRHKRYLLSPSILNKAGISYTTQVQRAGDVIVTFPGSYHFGFNTGFNVAESTNFAVPEWLSWGNGARVCLCHPHSVRIDMARFRTLLDRYEAEATLGNGDRMTYSEWARAEAARRAREQQEEEDSDGNDSEEEEGKMRYGKNSIRVVEVVKMKIKSTSASSSKRSKAKAKKKVAVEEDWRQALRVRPIVFTVGTAVLCFIRAEIEEDDDDDDKSVDDHSLSGYSERCFSGTIVDACEGHVRIHFSGTGRKDDAWFKADSSKLFLDGGPAEHPDSAEEEEAGENKNATAKKKQSKRQKLDRL